jgi:hypothetical protein
MDETKTPQSDSLGSWTGFLVVAFAALGLIGAFGTYAAQLPFDRAMARSATLDQLIAASHAPDPAAAEAKLRPLLGDAADELLKAPNPIEPRVEAERRRMFADMYSESKIYGFRLRSYIAVFTVMTALFGALVMSFGRKVANQPRTGA